MPGQQLTKHFHSREFDCRDGTQVPERDYHGLTYLCRTYLEPLRKKYGPVHINSGYRTAAYNRKIGGASPSAITSTRSTTATTRPPTSPAPRARRATGTRR